MLIIGRKRDQKIIINDDIEITILEIGRNRVRFGVQAPKSVRIHTKLQQLPSEPAGDKSDSRDSGMIERPSSPPESVKADPKQIQPLAGASLAYGRRSG